MRSYDEYVDNRLEIMENPNFDLSVIDTMLDEVSNKITGYEETAEEIITTALNVEQSNELIDMEIESMKKLVDNLRRYNKKLDELRKQVRQVSDLVW